MRKYVQMCSMWTVVIIFHAGQVNLVNSQRQFECLPSWERECARCVCECCICLCVCCMCVHMLCLCVCVSRRSMLGRRQKMRFADQWSLKHIYNGQSALALATACNQMRQLQSGGRGAGWGRLGRHAKWPETSDQIDAEINLSARATQN